MMGFIVSGPILQAILKEVLQIEGEYIGRKWELHKETVAAKE